MLGSPVLFALLGTLAWTGSVVWLRPAWATALFLLAPFVTVPLGLRLAATPSRDGLRSLSWRAAVVLQLPAACALAVSFGLPVSRLAMGLAAPWLLVTVLAALFGARRWLVRGIGSSEEACVDVALGFLAVGGVWAVLARGFARPLGFDPLVALSTATHFHYAGFALCLLVGLAGRRLPGGAPKLVVALVVFGVIALAAGIGAQVARLEMVAGWTLAFGGWLVTAMHLRLATLPGRPTFRVLIALSGLALACALVLAALYAARGLVLVPWIVDLGRMARLHGTMNAIGFALLALLAWSGAPPPARSGDPSVRVETANRLSAE